jgi:CheY-like chemotaxis protein
VPKTTPRILIVEDDPTLNEAYASLLSKAGYEIRVASNGQEALQMLAEWTPGLLLLSLRLPVMDGLTFLAHYQPIKHLATKVVILTNYVTQKEVDEAYRLGVDRYVLKTWVSPKALLRLVAYEFSVPKTKVGQ